jgi:hypothetical protein
VTDRLTPEPLMQLAAGLWMSKTLTAANELDLFTTLSNQGPMSTPHLARSLGLAQRPAELLTTACVSLGLLKAEPGGYRNSPLSEEFLVRGKPYYFGGWLRMLDAHDYPGWMRLTEALRGNRPTAFDPDRQDSIFVEDDQTMLEVFWDAMYALSSFTARTIGDVMDLSDRRSILDVGGGGAAYDIELCRRYPGLTATVFDLPFVCELTVPKIKESGLDNRITVTAGDFFTDPLPGGHDTMLLSSILHDWPEDTDRQLLAKCFQALDSGGLLLVAELFVDDDKTGPPNAALMSLAMLVEGWGRNYTGAEIQEWLRDTGFTDVTRRPVEAAGANSVLMARKP